MAMIPFDYQRSDVAKLAANNFTGLVRSGPGAGKTLTAICAQAQAGADVNLVIAPLGTHRTAWLPTYADQGIDARIVGNSKKEHKQALADLEWGVPGTYVMTPQLFTRMDVSTLRPDILITDEAHALSKPKSKGSRKWAGYYRDEPIHAGAKMALSGTPFRRDFERAWSFARHLYPHLDQPGQVAYKNFYAWRNERMEWQRDHFSPDGRKYVGEKNPGQFISELPCYVYHAAREQCCEFHTARYLEDGTWHPGGFLTLAKPQELEVEVQLLPEQKRALKSLEESYIAWLGENPMVVDLPVTLAMRLRQVALGVPTVTADGEVTFANDCKSPILDAAIERIHELDGESVVVFTSSQRFAAVAVERFKQAGFSAAEYSGATVKDRDNYLDAFGDSIQVLVVTYAAGGQGLDKLQVKATNEILLDVHVDDVLMEQAAYRVDRLGAKKQVQRTFLHDDEGLNRGVMSKGLEKRLAMNRSLRVAS